MSRPVHGGVGGASRAFLLWAEGLLEPDPAGARRVLGEAAGEFEALGRRIEVGRCLIDLAAAERRLGDDPHATLSRAREILRDCGAGLYLSEAAP